MKRLIAIVLLITALCSTSAADVRPAAMVVVDIDLSTYTITLQDCDGNLWQIEGGVQDWFYGDIAACIIDDSGTPDITDDIITTAVWNGWVEDWARKIM